MLRIKMFCVTLDCGATVAAQQYSDRWTVNGGPVARPTRVSPMAITYGQIIPQAPRAQNTRRARHRPAVNINS